MAIQPTQTDAIIPNKLSNRPRAIRFYQDDDDALVALHKLVKNMAPIDIVDLIRDCVKAGRPIIEARWKPLALEAKREAREARNQ